MLCRRGQEAFVSTQRDLEALSVTILETTCNDVQSLLSQKHNESVVCKLVLGVRFFLDEYGEISDRPNRSTNPDMNFNLGAETRNRHFWAPLLGCVSTVVYLLALYGFSN